MVDKIVPQSCNAALLIVVFRFHTKVCDENTEDYKRFNISLGDNSILEPKADLCSAKESWWSDSACPRAVVNTMAPLLVSKMITRAFLQPIITLLRWGFVETSKAKSSVFSTLASQMMS